LTSTVDGYEIAMKVRLSPQLLANFSSSNGDFYVATGATMKSGSGGQPLRTVNPTTPVDGDPDVPEDLFIYNDNQWYFFTALMFWMQCDRWTWTLGAGVFFAVHRSEFGQDLRVRMCRARQPVAARSSIRVRCRGSTWRCPLRTRLRRGGAPWASTPSRVGASCHGRR
jgi:hypothetical protein